MIHETTETECRRVSNGAWDKIVMNGGGEHVVNEVQGAKNTRQVIRSNPRIRQHNHIKRPRLYVCFERQINTALDHVVHTQRPKEVIENKHHLFRLTMTCVLDPMRFHCKRFWEHTRRTHCELFDNDIFRAFYL